MNDRPPRTQSLASCYENAITIVLRLGSQQQAVPNSQIFRTNIRAALKAAMEQARVLGYSNETIQLSFSAVVGFLDESVLMLQSPIFADWPQRPLQEELFGHNRMGEVFFENLRSLLAHPDTQEIADCLEVYCLTLLLGYRGRYALGGGGGEVETFVRPIREKIARIRGQMLFLRTGGPPPEVKQSRAIDRWSRTLGIAALCLLLAMLLAYGGFWFSLSTGLSQLG
jgi:type VI secretion system protein ImpK